MKLIFFLIGITGILNINQTRHLSFEQYNNCNNKAIFFSLNTKENVIIDENLIITAKGKVNYEEGETRINEYTHEILVNGLSVGRSYTDDEFENQSAVIASTNKSFVLKTGIKENVDLVAIKKDDLCNAVESMLQKKTIGYLSSAEAMNNKAFFLMNNGYYSASLLLYNAVIKKFPSRTVVYLNIGDAYWNLADKEKAIENYNQYVELMKTQKKTSRIPLYVYERIK